MLMTFSKKIFGANLRNLLLILLSIEVIIISISMAASSIAFVLAVILWIIIIIKDKKWVRTPLDFYFLLYIAAEILATIFSIEPLESLMRVKRIFIFSVFYMTFYSFKDERDIVKFIFLFGSYTAAISVIELVLKFTIVDIERLGVFQHYMTTGGIKMIVALYLIPLIFQKNLDSKRRTILICIILPILVALVVTMTRSSWIGFIFGIITFGFIKNSYSIAVLVVLIIVLAIFGPQNVKVRALSSFDPENMSNKPRINMIKTGWKMFKDHPVFGVGDMDLKKIYDTYTVAYEKEEGGHLHNIFMHILVTLGLFGFSAFILLFTRLFIHLKNVYKNIEKKTTLSSIAIIPLIIYIAFLINGLFEWNFGDQEIAILFWFTMGLSMVIYNINFDKNNSALAKS